MRTQDPANIRADFESAIADVETAITASEQSVAADAAKKLIAEYAFVSVATLLEGFVSDLFVAYINRNSQRFRDHLLNLVALKADDDYAKRAVPFVETSMPHLTVDQIRSILDSRGYNITFPTTDKMKQSAGTWLSDADKLCFTGTTPQECAIIDVTKAVRNFLAHRSQTADTTMQAALVSADLPAELKRAVNNVADVGVYLRSKQNGDSRLKYLIQQLRALASKLCP